MTDFRAPAHLFEKFVGATEDDKRQLRIEVVKWMQGLKGVEPGDRVIAPHPSTGEDQVFVKAATTQ